MTSFYRGTIESILTYGITVWYGSCTDADHKTLQRIARAAEKIIGVSLPQISDIYTDWCVKKAITIMTDPYNPPICTPAIWQEVQKSRGENQQVHKQFLSKNHQNIECSSHIATKQQL